VLVYIITDYLAVL